MPLPAAMDGLFADGVYLRLRSRARDTYLHADKDGEGLSLLPRGGDDGAPAEAGVWRVHRVLRDGDNYVLLHGAAYGRYLALSDEAAPHGCVGKRAVQRGYDDPELDAVMWKPSAVPDAPTSHVLMRHLLNGTLRANGRFRVWNNGVSIDMYFGNRSTMRQWIVEVVPPRPQGYVPVLPAPSETLQHHTFLFWWPGAREGARRRTIRYLHADQPLDFGPASNVPSFSYCSRSVYDLRNQLGIRVNHGHILGTIMCVQAGLYGRLTPLITDLTHSDEPLHVVVYTAGTPDAEALVYPDSFRCPPGMASAYSFESNRISYYFINIVEVVLLFLSSETTSGEVQCHRENSGRGRPRLMHSRAFSISVLSAQSINKTIEVLARLKALAKGPLAVLTSNRDKIVKSIQGLGSGGLLTLLWTNQETVMEKVIESIPFQWVKKVLKILVKLYKPAIIYGGVISSFELGVGWYTYKYGGWEQLWGMQISEELNGPILMIIADDALESNISRKEVLKIISQNGFTAVIPLCVMESLHRRMTALKTLDASRANATFLTIKGLANSGQIKVQKPRGEGDVATMGAGFRVDSQVQFDQRILNTARALTFLNPLSTVILVTNSDDLHAKAKLKAVRSATPRMLCKLRGQ